MFELTIQKIKLTQIRPSWQETKAAAKKKRKWWKSSTKLFICGTAQQQIMRPKQEFARKYQWFCYCNCYCSNSSINILHIFFEQVLWMKQALKKNTQSSKSLNILLIKTMPRFRCWTLYFFHSLLFLLTISNRKIVSPS